MAAINFKALEEMDDEEVYDVVNMQDESGATALHYAIIQRNVEDVLRLLRFRADCTLTNADGNTPLHLAAQSGNLEVLNLVAEATDDLDTENNDGETPVMLAAHAGLIGAVVALTSMDKHVVPADTSIVDHCGRTILMHACISGDMDLVRLLILNKEGISQQTSISRVTVNAVDDDGRSALMYAAMEGHWPLVSVLVLSGANIAIKDSRGFTALHWAAAQGNPATVAALCDCGAVLDEKDEEEWTPLMHSVCENNLESSQLLVDMGANPDHTLTLAKNHAMHLMLCDAIRKQVVGPWLQEKKVSGRFVVSLLRATDLYVDPSALGRGSPSQPLGDIYVYGVIQFKSNGDPDDAEMVGVTPAIRIPSLQKEITKSIEWNEVVTFYLKNKSIYPDASLVIELFATRDLTGISELLNLKHAAGEDTGKMESHKKKREKMDSMYRAIHEFEMGEGNAERNMMAAPSPECKKRWTQLAEQRRRFEKYSDQHMPLPPVPLTHLPIGSVIVSASRLREVFRGQLSQFNKYPRGAERGQVRFDVDFVPTGLDRRIAISDDEPTAPQTPRESELPPIHLPESLLKQYPDLGDVFAPRCKKFAQQCKDQYARYWTRFDPNNEETGAGTTTNAPISQSKAGLHKLKEYEKESRATITIIAQAMMR